MDCLEVCQCLDALNRVLRDLPYQSAGQNLIHEEARYLSTVTARAKKAAVATKAAEIKRNLNNTNADGSGAAIRTSPHWDAAGDNYSAVARLNALGGAWEMGHGGDRHGDHGITWAPNHVVDYSEADLQVGSHKTSAPDTGCAGGTDCQGDRTVWTLVHSNTTAKAMMSEVMTAANGLGSSYVTAVWDASKPSAAPTTTLDLIKWYVNGHVATGLPTADPTVGPTGAHATFPPTTVDQYNSLTPTVNPTTPYPTFVPRAPEKQAKDSPVVGTPGSPKPNGVAEARVIELVKQYSKGNDDSGNTAAVVLGVIVGLMVLAGFIGVGYWYQNKRADHQARGRSMAAQIQGKQNPNLAVA